MLLSIMVSAQGISPPAILFYALRQQKLASHAAFSNLRFLSGIW